MANTKIDFFTSYTPQFMGFKHEISLYEEAHCFPLILTISLTVVFYFAFVFLQLCQNGLIIKCADNTYVKCNSTVSYSLPRSNYFHYRKSSNLPPGGLILFLEVFKVERIRDGGLINYLAYFAFYLSGPMLQTLEDKLNKKVLALDHMKFIFTKKQLVIVRHKFGISNTLPLNFLRLLLNCRGAKIRRGLNRDLFQNFYLKKGGLIERGA